MCILLVGLVHLSQGFTSVIFTLSYANNNIFYKRMSLSRFSLNFSIFYL